MLKLNKALPLAFLAATFLQPCVAVLDHRAQSWKPQQAVGSAQLSIADITTIVLPPQMSDELRASVDDLLEQLQVHSGAVPKLVSEGHPKNALYFEHVQDGREGGAFTIQRERTRVIIRSADQSGWRNALYAIMNDLLGARWYWSGDVGFELVPPSQAHFPNRSWREAPAFVQRRFYPVNTDFARRNRLNSVYSFNHNLAKVFNRELFESKPEVFSLVNGRRRAPLGSGATDPQPDFTQPGAVEVAAQAALNHFAEHPDSTSFSLSINDNVLFDTSERTQAAVSPLRYFRGRPDYTNLVFGFMNQVAERVFEVGGAWQTPSGEDRYLTALSYYWTEPAPAIRIHPRVMPVLTSDRAQWHDPDYRQQDKDLIRAWTRSGAERVATWDYYFGAPYPYPRQFNQWIAESLRYMADEGVDVFFSQLPSFWGLDGAKAWLGSELLWDPTQDADALLDEYYACFFGAASGAMRAFYETAEDYRNQHEGAADWIKLYKDESSIALFTPEVLQQMRAYLQVAADNVAAEPDALRYQQRVEVVSEAFRLTELYASFDQSRRALVTACLDGEPSAGIQILLEIFKAADQAYRSYFEGYVGSSSYAPERRSIALGQSNPERLAMGLLQEAPGAFESLSEDPTLKHRDYRARDFLGPALPRVAGWYLDYRASEHFKVEASQHSKLESAGLRLSGADIVSIFRTFPVVEQDAYEFRLTGNWKTSLDNRVNVHVAWLDRDGRSLESEMPLRLPIEHRSQPTTIRLPFVAPDNASDVRLRIVISRQYPGDFLDLSELDFGRVAPKP
ncbi:DUF4838 domain-containing protein [Coraliomargarita algicola]|uniref:DUF4838 domain-containing protein n=1 Tax=Coraliomargarita algicola TaxID=3092156 RepID=A0ABZ0RGK2_9BACT|nr:DUF4838 domain-containing protein [Coraliomargarita sp. J2-16]WPJ94653.1 DUF4838 domain-containing protein [Coraliomargarita sp. J2-16]